MVRKDTLYRLAIIAWGVLVAAAVILVYSGNAEPYVAASTAPSVPVAVGGGIVGWLVGAFVLDRLRKRDWKAAGRAHGLRPSGLGLLGAPEMTGTVDGRSVRVRTRSKTTGGGDDASNEETFTVVEADLSGPADRGFMAGSSTASAAGELEGFGLEAVEVDGVGVVGGDEAFVRKMLDGRTRDAIAALPEDDTLLVGDAGATVQAALEEATGSGIAGAFASMASRATDEFAGDASTVSLEMKGLVLDADRMGDQLEAVVATAEAFERAAAAET